MAVMYGKEVDVTPKMAADLIATNPKNRALKKNKINKYKMQIVTGGFECTHQGIAITEEGKLIDGHHRLTAIVETGITVRLFVVYNAKESSKIDQGAARSDRDSMYMSGTIEKGSIEYNTLVYPLTGFIVRRLFGDSTYRLISGAEKHNVYVKFQSQIDDVINIVNKQSHGQARGRSSSVLYPMLLAINNGVPFDDVKDWYRILMTGDFYFEGDDLKTRAGTSVLKFKNCLESRKISGQIGMNDEDEVIKKAESSIRYFAQRQPIQKLYGEFVYPELVMSKDEIFNMKGEQQ